MSIVVVGPDQMPDWLEKKANIFHEIERQLIRGLQKPGTGLTLEQLQVIVVEHRNPFGPEVAGTLKRDMRKEGWKLLEHTPRRLTSANIEGISFLKQSESSIGGEEMVRRARIELDANYGQEDAEFLLEHQKKIPVELRPYYLLFTATVWEGPFGTRHVAYLAWDGKQWYLNFFLWLGNVWRVSARLPRPRGK